MNLLTYRLNRTAIRTLVVATLAAAATAGAHRMPGSLSTIKVNPATGRTEIIHRLHNHDAEFGIVAVLDDRTVTLDTLIGRAQLALYVEERFLVAAVEDGQVGAPLVLDLVGAELDGEFVLVYQELDGDLPAAIAVRDDILRDVLPEQVNYVNIAVGGAVRSLTFQGDDEWQLAKLE
jgi:hypothetical protein